MRLKLHDAELAKLRLAAWQVAASKLMGNAPLEIERLAERIVEFALEPPPPPPELPPALELTPE